MMNDILMNVIEFANEVSNTTDTPGTDKPEEEASIGGKIVSVLGTMISIGLNLTPILLFYRYFKKTAGLETIPETMFITGIFCCATNLAYAIIISDQIMTISNVVCYGLQVAYGTIYIFITNHKRIDKLLLYLIIAWDLSFEVLFIFGNILEYHWGKDFADDFTGIVNIIIGTLNVITPGQNIIKVCKTGNFTLIPIVTIFFQCACSSLWFVYGLTLGNIKVILPNAMGTVLTSIQIATYYFWYIRNHGNPPPSESKGEDEEGDEKIQQGENNESPQGDPDNKLLNDSSQ